MAEFPIDVAVFPEQVGDPVAAANRGKVYTKDVAGVTQFFYEASDGTVTQLTPAASGSSPSVITVGSNETTILLSTEVPAGSVYLDPVALGVTSVTLRFAGLLNTTDPAGTAIIRLYDMGPGTGAFAPILRATISIAFANVGEYIVVNQLLTLTPAPGVNVNQIFDTARIYEARMFLSAANGSMNASWVGFAVAP